MSMELYDELVAAGATLDNHESDLYVKVTPEASKILHAHKAYVHAFVSPKDGCAWYEVPFMYLPFWRAQKAEGDGR